MLILDIELYGKPRIFAKIEVIGPSDYRSFYDVVKAPLGIQLMYHDNLRTFQHSNKNGKFVKHLLENHEELINPELRKAGVFESLSMDSSRKAFYF